MRMSRVCFNIGAWTFIVVGVAHIGFNVPRMLSSTRPAIIDAMREYMTPRGVDLLSLYDGYSLMMGILLIAVGLLNVFFSKLDTDFPVRSKSVIALNIGLIAYRYTHVDKVLLRRADRAISHIADCLYRGYRTAQQGAQSRRAEVARGLALR
jgi:hypothetical protein